MLEVDLYGCAWHGWQIDACHYFFFFFLEISHSHVMYFEASDLAFCNSFFWKRDYLGSVNQWSCPTLLWLGRCCRFLRPLYIRAEVRDDILYS